MLHSELRPPTGMRKTNSPPSRRSNRPRPTVHDVLRGWQQPGGIDKEHDQQDDDYALFNCTNLAGDSSSPSPVSSSRAPSAPSAPSAPTDRTAPAAAVPQPSPPSPDSPHLPPSRSFLGIPELDITSPYLTFTMKGGAEALRVLNEGAVVDSPEDVGPPLRKDEQHVMIKKEPIVTCACLAHDDRVLLDALYAVPVDTVAAEAFGDGHEHIEALYRLKGAQDVYSEDWLRDAAGRWVSRGIKYTMRTERAKVPVTFRVEETQMVLQHEALVLVVETATTSVLVDPPAVPTIPKTTTTIQRCCITPAEVGGRRGARVKVQARVEGAMRSTRLGSVADETVVKSALETLIASTRCLDEHIIRLVAHHRGEHIQLQRGSSRSSSGSSASAASSTGAPPTAPKNTSHSEFDILPDYLTRGTPKPIQLLVTPASPVGGKSGGSSGASSLKDLPMKEDADRRQQDFASKKSPHDRVAQQSSAQTIVVAEDHASPPGPREAVTPSAPPQHPSTAALLAPPVVNPSGGGGGLLKVLRKAKNPPPARQLHQHQNKSCPALSSAAGAAAATNAVPIIASDFHHLKVGGKPGGPRPFGGWLNAGAPVTHGGYRVPPEQVYMVPPPVQQPLLQFPVPQPPANFNAHPAAARGGLAGAVARDAEEARAVVWDGRKWAEAHPVVAQQLVSQQQQQQQHLQFPTPGRPAPPASTGSTGSLLKREGGAVAVWNGVEYVMHDGLDVCAGERLAKELQQRQRPATYHEDPGAARVGTFQPLEEDDGSMNMSDTTGSLAGEQSASVNSDEIENLVLAAHDLCPKTPSEAAEWRAAAAKRLKVHLEAKRLSEHGLHAADVVGTIESSADSEQPAVEAMAAPPVMDRTDSTVSAPHTIVKPPPPTRINSGASTVASACEADEAANDYEKEYRRRRARQRQEHRLERLERLQWLEQQERRQQQIQRGEPPARESTSDSVELHPQSPPSDETYQTAPQLQFQHHHHQPQQQLPNPPPEPLIMHREPPPHIKELLAKPRPDPPPFYIREVAAVFFTLLALHTVGALGPAMSVVARLALRGAGPVLAVMALCAGAVTWVYK
ncbi:hypothetical protein HDU87_002172 [Geranomyces variabilis]|uniref:VASt domain-containing protein n=1 Tax=Geranomyces variabilis TaxID=109894 RepID=A0AAD5XNZ4_9FUNG|nr:hypothetical protein HDU87_002172 [Geranomyces variabilis]